MTLTAETIVISDIAPAVEFRVTSTSEITRIVRSDRNGAKIVRLEYPFNPAVRFHDYEAAYGKSSYEIFNAGGENLQVEVMIRQTLPALHQVLRPTLQVNVDNISDYSHTRESGNLIQEGYLTEFPHVTFGKPRSRQMNLTINCESFTQAAAVEQVVLTPGVFMLRVSEHEGLDAYLVVENTSITAVEPNGDKTTWEVTLAAREVPAPSGTLQTVAVNSYSDALAAYTTYFDDSLARATYQERSNN